MKGLGVEQFLQKTYKTIEISKEFEPILGDMEKVFVGAVYGESGHGKTEFCVKLAKEFTRFGRVAWLSYEQGHSKSLQSAIIRNNMKEVSSKIVFLDPSKKRPEGVSIFEHLMQYLGKRSTPDFVFVDSGDYVRMTKDQYFALKERYGEKKGIIFICHANGRKFKTPVTEEIGYNGEFSIYVKNFIARPQKSRTGGTEAYIIYEKLARERDPLFFKKRELQQPTTKKSKPRKK